MKNARPSWVFLLSFPLLIIGCTREDVYSRRACVAEALIQPSLQNGVAAFTETDGSTSSVGTSWHSKFRLQTNHPYHVASLTKLLVAAEIRNLIHAGSIELNTPVASLLPDHAFTGDNTRRITVRHLLQHTSGFGHPKSRDPLWYRQNTTPEPDCAAAARYLLTVPTEHPPGEQTSYSNTGYCLLAEVLLHLDTQQPSAGTLDAPFRRVLQSPYGGAGGWRASLPSAYAALHSTLPLEVLPHPPHPLSDGSWYNHGWRWWPQLQAGAPWTHTGRLQGFLAVALTDGRDRLLVAHFDGDPADFHATAARFGKQAWACME